jgi:hypothetical protein
MKKNIRLTESELTRVIRKIISEEQEGESDVSPKLLGLIKTRVKHLRAAFNFPLNMIKDEEYDSNLESFKKHLQRAQDDVDKAIERLNSIKPKKPKK